MKIVIFQPMLKQYRVRFFELLEQQLEDKGHELRVVFGSPPADHLSRNDNVILKRDNYYYPKSHWYFNNKLHNVDNALNHILWADLIITEQANRHLFNYIIILMYWIKLKKFAYWGHGKNLQGDASSFKEKLKKSLVKHCNWWFTYTNGVKDYISSEGYPSERITSLNNSVDTSSFKSMLSNVSEADVLEYRKQLKLNPESEVALYCGALYKDKTVQFLLDSAVKIYSINPKFNLIIAGSGPEKNVVESYANKYDFIKYIGPVFDAKKAVVFKSADLFLCPGLVGLAILDAFTASLPLITTNITWHSPEIEYLKPDYNGLITSHDVEEFSSKVNTLIASPKKLQMLQINAEQSSIEFSLEKMVDNFVTGIINFENYYEL